MVLNGQESSLPSINVGVPKDLWLILGPPLIYINDLSDRLNFIPKLFADYTLLFSIVQDLNESAKYSNLDLSVISRWAYQWKMLFNPDPSKTAHKVIFSKKKDELTHPSVSYNDVEVSRADSQKHLRLVLDNKVTFKKHINNKLNKA